MERKTLFREQYLSKRFAPPKGSIVIPAQRAVAIAAAAGIVGMLSLITALSQLSYTSYDRAKAFVVTREEASAVISPFSSEVEVVSVFYKPGDEVIVGAPVLELKGGISELNLAATGRTNSFAKISSTAGADESAVLFTTVGGIVDRSFASPGNKFAPGDPILTVRPSTRKLSFDVLADSRMVSRLRVSESVAISVDAYPRQRYPSISGTVKSISESPYNPQQVSFKYGVQPPPESVYIISVQADEDSNLRGYSGLRDGMSATISVSTEKMSLLRWIASSLINRGKRAGES